MEAVKDLNRIIEYYHENKLSHAYLIETNNLEICFSDLKKVIKQILCQNGYTDECSKCNICNLLDNSNLPSFIVVEPDGKNIKKEQVIELKSRFSSLPVFTKENIYVIKEAEKLNSSSANTMLKFIEEPEDHIIGFFITNNINNVINTIRSRCEIIRVKYIDDTEEILSNPYIDVLYKYLQKIELEKEYTIMYNKNILLKEYQEREEIKKIFWLMLVIYKKCLNLENEQQETSEFKEKFSFLINQEKSELLKKIKIIVEYIDQLNYNVNIELFLDKFVMELSGLHGQSI